MGWPSIQSNEMQRCPVTMNCCNWRQALAMRRFVDKFPLPLLEMIIFLVLIGQSPEHVNILQPLEMFAPIIFAHRKSGDGENIYFYLECNAQNYDEINEICCANQCELVDDKK